MAIKIYSGSAGLFVTDQFYPSGFCSIKIEDIGGVDYLTITNTTTGTTYGVGSGTTTDVIVGGVKQVPMSEVVDESDSNYASTEDFLNSIGSSAGGGGEISGSVSLNDDAGTPISDSNPLPVGGGVADDAVDSGNPVKIGGVADNDTLSNVSVGDRVNALFTLSRKLVIAAYDWALDSLKVVIQNPIWSRYTDKENIVSGVDIASVDDTWADLGNEISAVGYKKVAIWVDYTANDSVGGKIRIMSRHTSSGTNYSGVSDPVYVITLADEPKWYDFEVDNILPYLQIQGYVTTTGATEGTITIDITKGY